MADLSLANAVSRLSIRCKITNTVCRRAPAVGEDLYKCDVLPKVVKPHLAFCAHAGNSGRFATRGIRWRGGCGFSSVDHPVPASFAPPCVRPQGIEVGFTNHPSNDMTRGQMSTRKTTNHSGVRKYAGRMAPLFHNLEQLQTPFE